MLHFICSYFNFSDSIKIKENYIKFRKHFPHPITTIEVALPHQQFFIEDSIKIRSKPNNIFWQKERCLNLAIETLPLNAQAIAWIDTDIRFYNRHFAKDTLKQLDRYSVVQMFDTCFETPKINEYNNNTSLGFKLTHDHEQPTYPHVGFCWAFRKDILVNNKLYDCDPVGNGDVLQLMAWMGIWNHQYIIDLNLKYRKEFLLWAWDSWSKVQGNIGYTKGAVEHFFHGSIHNRKYLSRNNILTAYNFAPSTDLRIDDNNLYAINNSLLLNNIKSYLEHRRKTETVYPNTDKSTI